MIKSHNFPDGSKLFHKKSTQEEFSSITLVIPAGNRYENSANAGISHLIEHLLYFSPQNNQPVEKYGELLHRYNIHIYAKTTYEYILITVSCIHRYIEQAIKVISLILSEINIDNAILERTKNIVRTEIRQRKDFPDIHIQDLFNERIWQNSSSGFKYPTIGTYQTVSKLSASQILSFRDRILRHPLYIAVVGNLDSGGVAEYINKNIATPRVSQLGSIEDRPLEEQDSEVISHKNFHSHVWVEKTLHLQLDYLLVGFPFYIEYSFENILKLRTLINYLQVLIHQQLTKKLGSVYNHFVHLHKLLDHTWIKVLLPINPILIDTTLKEFFSIISTIGTDEKLFLLARKKTLNDIVHLKNLPYSQLLAEAAFYGTELNEENISSDFIQKNIKQTELATIAREILVKERCNVLAMGADINLELISNNINLIK
ncbi:MAG: insulinase family protein [Patescibacteria group bacterium]|nr:insulinase family protein [Patescibacteria group bacterium]